MRVNRSRLVAALALLVLSAAVAAAGPAAEGKATATAIFAGGCFWCMVHPFDELPGVASVTSGYTGGHKVNPTYEEVSTGDTGHVESVKIVYDPAKIGYEKLLDVFWHNVDPLDGGGQFCDRGSTYRSEIFYGNDEQRRLAEQSKATIEKQLKHPVVTEIRPTSTFYAAEDYHQNYYKKNPLRYKYYRYSCGRDQRLEALWGKQG
jgi:peptide-methionine (S)-S-oxide reductase